MPPPRRYLPSSQRAQAVIEFVLAWPIILLAICFVTQLLWLWWAQQTLHTATQYAVRVGAINHGSQNKMRNMLILGMAGIKPQLQHNEAVTAAAEAAVKQGIHYALYGRLKVLQPTKQHFQRFAERRWDNEQRRYIREIAVDHYAARQAQDDSEEWAKARILHIETQWCEDLKIPLVAEFMGQLALWRGNCVLGNGQGRPQWPLSSSAQHEMLSGYRR